jgi:protein O-GlcNAc transferase
MQPDSKRSDSKQLTRQGAAHHRAGDLQAAKADYAAALQAAPDNAGAWHLLGQLLHGEGDTQAAITHITRALQLDPSLAGAAFNLAVLYEQAGHPGEAETHFKAHLVIQPGDTAALFALARLQHRHGRRDTAAETYRRLLGLDPPHLAGRINLGACLNELGRPGDAIRELRVALDQAPDDAVALNNMGMANQAQGRNAAAHGYLLRAHRRDAGNPVIAANLARTGLRLGHYGASLAVLESALAAAPSNGPLRALNALALPYIAGSAEALHDARARMEAEMARLGDCDAPIEEPLSEVGMSNFQAVYHGRDDRPLQQALAAFYVRACPDLGYTAPHCRGPARPGAKIKIGFVSAHLGSHTIGKLNRHLIAGLDPQKFEVHVFALGGPVAGLDGAAVHTPPANFQATRAAIADAELDIVYYPDIGMEPMSYFLGFARLAPLQCVTWGHPVTTGLAAIDYFLSNKMAEPEDAQAHYTEKLILSDRLDVCYGRPAPPGDGKPRAALGLPEKAHIYLCAQSLFKVHPDMDAAFAAILEQDPNAEILFIDGQQESWSAALQKRFQSTVPGADRMRFIPRLGGADFAQLIAAADILLDTFPFSGGNTSFEALAQGKPVVTLPGAYFGGRFTYALLRQMAVLDTVAGNAGDYARIAVQLGCEEDRRRQLKDTILAAGDAIFETRAFIGERQNLLEELLDAVRAGQGR